jgi:iron complex outermembrane receptor protein
LGADYNDERYDGPIWYDGVAPDLDLFNPVLGTAPHYFPTRADFQPWGSVQKWIGLYAQDQIHISDRLIVNVGGRFDRAKGAFSPDPVADAVTETAFKPRFGAVYLPAPNVSLYAQYQEGFGPNNGRSSAGTAFKGQTATQTEIGVKWQSSDGSLIATLAAFDLTKQRLLTADLSTPDPLDRVAIGEVRNRGIELDVSGQVTERLSVIGSYAYSDAQTTKDDSGFQGKRYQGVPRHAGSIWVRYQATNAFAFGGGVFAEDDRPGDLGNTFLLPGYGRVDAFAQYAFAVNDIRWIAQINVNNIFDQRYFAGVYNNSRDFILPGSPRAATFTLRAAF